MIGTPSRPALLGIAVLCALVVGACSNGPSLQFVGVTPAQGTVFFSTGRGAAVARAHTPRSGTRQAAISAQDLSTASCRSFKFKATVFFSDGSSVDESSLVSWTSSNESV